jgi:16S rRNA (cytosine967-C5)-methyltransferase
MRTGGSSRRQAVLCLTAWDRERQAIQPFIESMIYRSSLAAGDRHLAVMLVHGVLRRMQHLDAVVSRFSTFPLSKMKPLTRMALRVGVYQLLFLDRVPESAAVNETVNVLKEEHQPRWLVNFVNGVLRSVTKNRTALRGVEREEEGGTGIPNHPEWLVRRWEEAYGRDTARKICRRNNREPVLTIRVNTLRTDAAELAGRFRDRGYEVRPGRYAPQSLVFETFSGTVADLPGYGEGLFHVQDEAAQMVSLLLAPFDRETAHLDACAGPGGKTCHLAQLLADGAELTAVEPNNYRFRLLEQNIRRLHLAGRVTLFHGRLGRFAETLPDRFHRIVVDAPCSGTGVIGRHPDIRWNRQPGDLQILQKQQLKLLGQAASLLLPGGILVYATCSLEQEENQGVIESFLRADAAFTATDCRDFISGPARELVDPSGYFRSTPADGLDGFFAVRLVRRH